MKIALLADIHGNKYALAAVLDSAKKHNISQLYIAGDLVGYYPYVNEIFSLLENWNCLVIKGNHEEILIKCMEDKVYNEKIKSIYGSSHDIAIKKLNEERKNFIKQLQHPLLVEKYKIPIVLCHGSPVDINQYIYPDTNLEELDWLKEYKNHIIICGHTHYPMLRKEKSVMIVNPGSVGQPRNSGSAAHWAIFNTETLDVELKTTNYDVQSLIETSKSIDPDLPYLQKVFTR